MLHTIPKTHIVFVSMFIKELHHASTTQVRQTVFQLIEL
jgi:hypothetical protein